MGTRGSIIKTRSGRVLVIHEDEREPVLIALAGLAPAFPCGAEKPDAVVTKEGKLVRLSGWSLMNADDAEALGFALLMAALDARK